MLRIPSKGQALAYAICLAGLSFVLFAANAATCPFPFLLVALGYGGVWFYKFQKDQHIVETGKTLYLQNTSTIGRVAPPMSDPRSSGLFVPPGPDR